MQKPSPLQSVITFIGLILLINCGGPSQPDESETDLLEQAWSLYHNDD